MVASDVALARGISRRRHFPRVLGVYVREKTLLTLPEAVRKMTSLPENVSMEGSGVVREAHSPISYCST